MNAALQLAIETSLRAAALAACVATILAVGRVRSGAVRHAAWAAVLAAMLLMPVLPRLTPALDVPVPMPIAAEPAPLMPNLPPALLMPSAPAQSQPIRAAPSLPAPQPHGPAWPIVLLAVYTAGLLFLLLRIANGWRGARCILRSCEPVQSGAGLLACFLKDHGRQARRPAPPVCQTSLITSPLTIGVLSPRIVLPCAWPTWPEAKLRAVLAHEGAHVRRRDAIVALAADLNQCLFWFHPLAWWLERQLAITAEHACDEAAVRATGQVREYAEILVDLAETVRGAGGRLCLQGVGMDGAAPLEHRIARILRGDLARTVSRPRKAAVALACAAAIFLAAACQPSRDTLVAKAEARQRQQQEKSARWAAYSKADRDLRQSAAALTPERAAAMEAALTANPDDFETRKKLLVYHAYYARQLETRPDQAERIAASVRRDALWMIGHHPEDPAPANNAAFWLGSANRGPDTASYAQARSLWLERADRDGQPPEVYLNAAQFFDHTEPPLAERMLLRAQAADPKGESLHGMYGDSWSARMGAFYGQTLNFPRWSKNPPWSGLIGPANQDLTGYLAEVRRKLEQSKDITLLLNAAGTLLMVGPGYDSLHRWDAAFAAGKAAVERALQLDPKSTWARQIMNKVHDQELMATLPRAVWQGTLDQRREAIEALPEGDRFRELSLLAISAAAAWQQAAGYAREALDLAPKVRNHPDYGTAFFRANMVLGMAAVTSGDTKTAAEYLLKAADAPATDELRYPMAGERPWTNLRFPDALTAALLKAGERDAVAKFLDRYAKLCVTQHETALEDAALIRSGKAPSWVGL